MKFATFGLNDRVIVNDEHGRIISASRTEWVSTTTEAADGWEEYDIVLDDNRILYDFMYDAAGENIVLERAA